MLHFANFIEDYNTATMPHEKYYDLARWEALEQQRELYKKAKELEKRRNEGVLDDIPRYSYYCMCTVVCVCPRNYVYIIDMSDYHLMVI